MMLFILLILIITLSLKNSFNINYDIKRNKNSNIQKCYSYYLKYVQSIQNKNNYTVSFNEYVEYWLINNETNDIIYEIVCKYIYENYPKKNLRT